MKYSTAILSLGFAALVAAVPQATTSSPGANPTIACINACDPTDTNCRAHCQGLPVPDAAAISATNQCEANCPKGSGTAADNDTYATCLKGCVSSLYFTASSTGTPAIPTVVGGSTMVAITTTTSSNASGVTTSTGSGVIVKSTTTSTGSGTTSTGTMTSTSAAPKSTNAAGKTVFNVPAVGLMGVLAAVFAL